MTAREFRRHMARKAREQYVCYLMTFGRLRDQHQHVDDVRDVGRLTLSLPSYDHADRNVTKTTSIQGQRGASALHS